LAVVERDSTVFRFFMQLLGVADDGGSGKTIRFGFGDSGASESSLALSSSTIYMWVSLRYQQETYTQMTTFRLERTAGTGKGE
jgi:hypothetical protein